MRNIRVLLVGLTVIALAAGVVAGVLAARLPAASATSGRDISTVSSDQPTPQQQQSSRSPLEEELNLTPKQREQMRRIWEDVRDQVNQCFVEGQQLSHQRDNDIVAMLTDEQKAKFEKISKDYHDRWLKLGEQREQAFSKGVDETNKILTERQQKKYAEIISKRLGHMPATEPSDGQLVSPLPPSGSKN